MLKTFAVILLAAELGAGFTAASAELVSTTTNAVEVQIRVEIDHEAESVVAHLTSPGRSPVVIPLVSDGDGVYSIRTELMPVNYQVVFETLGPNSASSEPASLMELGLVFESVSDDEVTTTSADGGDQLGEDTQRWGWLAVAFGAAALSALAFWVLGGESQSSTTGSSDESTDVEPS